jgi:hydroxymethylbilane synthase
VAIRGNVDTRLRKLAASPPEGEGDPSQRLHAIVLARAGLQRLGREGEAHATLDPERFVPAPGQGILALEGRADDEDTRTRVRAINDPNAFACLLAERALAHELSASCHTPLGAYARPVDHDGLLLRAWVGLPDGSQWIGDVLRGAHDAPEALGRQVAQRMASVGAEKLLARAEDLARAPDAQ